MLLVLLSKVQLMDNYNRVARLLSFGLTDNEIVDRIKLSKTRVTTIKQELRDSFFQDEKSGYTLTIDDQGNPIRVKFEV